MLVTSCAAETLLYQMLGLWLMVVGGGFNFHGDGGEAATAAKLADAEDIPSASKLVTVLYQLQHSTALLASCTNAMPPAEGGMGEELMRLVSLHRVTDSGAGQAASAGFVLHAFHFVISASRLPTDLSGTYTLTTKADSERMP